VSRPGRMERRRGAGAAVGRAAWGGWADAGDAGDGGLNRRIRMVMLLPSGRARPKNGIWGEELLERCQIWLEKLHADPNEGRW
jgi:hypothetical protein